MAQRKQPAGAPAKDEAASSDTVTRVLRISAKRNGFRRCGIAHPDRPVDHPIDRFTETEIEVLKSEPQLVVVEAEVPAAESASEQDETAEQT